MAKLFDNMCSLTKMAIQYTDAGSPYWLERSTVQTPCKMVVSSMSTENETAGNKISDAVHIVYLPAGIDVTTGDVITVNGTRYDVVSVTDRGVFAIVKCMKRRD
jgi:hypothetical protein